MSKLTQVYSKKDGDMGHRDNETPTHRMFSDVLFNIPALKEAS